MRDRAHPALELAIGERIGAHDGALANAHLGKVVLIKLGAHREAGHVAEQHQPLLR